MGRAKRDYSGSKGEAGTTSGVRTGGPFAENHDSETTSKAVSGTLGCGQSRSLMRKLFGRTRRVDLTGITGRQINWTLLSRIRPRKATG